jgi:hypothetical protein
MFTPVPQYASSSDGSMLQCTVMLGILLVVGFALYSLNSRTENAPMYSRTVVTSLPRERVLEIIKKAFPRSIISKRFNWDSVQLAYISTERSEASIPGYYLSNGQGCLVLLITGLIPGYLLLYSIMKQTEKVTVSLSNLAEAGEITFEAKGLRAQKLVDKLVEQLQTQTSS